MESFDYLALKMLYEHKNVTNAAKALYISQPALTERIKRIENHLNVKIVKSSNKGISFTHIGEHIVEFAHEMLTKEALLKNWIANMSSHVTGVLRIGAPSIIARFYMPNLVQKFSSIYSQVTFDITVADSSTILNMMKTDKLDIGFLREDFGCENAKKKLLTENHLCAVSKFKFKLKDLPLMGRIDYQTDTYFRNFLDQWWDDNYTKKPNILMQVSNIDLCKEMVFSGVGFGILPSIILVDHPEVFKIPLKDKDGNLIKRKTWMVCRNDIASCRLIKTFYDFVETCNFESFLRRY